MSLQLLSRTCATDKQPKKVFLSTTLNAARRTGTHPLARLQQALGNRSVAGLIQARRLTAETGFVIQPKLVVGPAHDHYEQEADAVANRVMTMPVPPAPRSVQRQPVPEEKDEEKTLQTKPLAAAITPLVQRQTMPEEEEKKPVQAKPLSASITPFVQCQMAPEEDKEKPLQTKPLTASVMPLVQREMIPDEDKEKKPVQAKLTDSSAALLQREIGTDEEKETKEQPIQAKLTTQREAGRASFEADEDVETRLARSKGGGSPLPDHVRRYMEPRFGADVSGVRVHTDQEAAQMNQAVGAQAFTHGQDIYFGVGKSPEVSDLTAHELTHVVQQTGGKLLRSAPPRLSSVPSRRIQRYPVPGTLECEDVVNWLDNNSPYRPEWAQTHCTYTFHGKLRISPPVTSSAGVSLTVSGHRGLRVSVSCPIDRPQWSPSRRQDRAAVLAAWRRMRGSLDAHEQQHRAIGRTWRATLEARFRGIRFAIAGVDRADAMRQVREEIASLQQQWIDEAQAGQDAIDPFRGAVLNCP